MLYLRGYSFITECFWQLYVDVGLCDAGDKVLTARLKLVGSCRGPADASRIEALKASAVTLGIDGSVDWCVHGLSIPHITQPG